MSGSGSHTPRGGFFTTDAYMTEDSKGRLMEECLSKRAELMDNAKNQSLASVDCQFEWTLSGPARKIPGAKHLMEYGTKPHQTTHWDTLDLGTLSRAIDNGHVRVRAWDEYPKTNAKQPQKQPMYLKKVDLFTRCIRLIDAKLGTSMSWDADSQEAGVLVNSFSKPFELKLRNQCLYWQFTPDYPAFPSVKGGIKAWSDQEVRKCDDALRSGQLWLVACSSDIRATSTMRPESSSPATSVPQDPKWPETTRPPRSINAGPEFPTTRHQTPTISQPVLGPTQPDITRKGSYPVSEIGDGGPPSDILSRLNKQSEEISTLQSQLKRVQTQAASSHSKIQALQLELDVAKSGLKQSESDVVLLRTEVQDMKDFINKRSSVTCDLEFLTENLKERLEKLESQAHSAPSRLGHHTPEPTESLPEVRSNILGAVPAIKMETTRSEMNSVDTPFQAPNIAPDSSPFETHEDVRRSDSIEGTTSIYESLPEEGEVSSEPSMAPSHQIPDNEQGPPLGLKEAVVRSNNPVCTVGPSREACLKELGISLTVEEGQYINKVSLISRIYKNWGEFPSKILPLLPSELGRHQHLLRKLANLSSKVPRGVAIRLLQEIVNDRDEPSPHGEVITKRDLDNALAQASDNVRRLSSRPHQVHNRAIAANLSDITDKTDEHNSSVPSIRGSAENKKRRLSGSSRTSSPRKRIRPNVDSYMGGDSSSS